MHFSKAQIWLQTRPFGTGAESVGLEAIHHVLQELLNEALADNKGRFHLQVRYRRHGDLLDYEAILAPANPAIPGLGLTIHALPPLLQRENQARNAILEAVLQKPGQTFQELRAIAGVSRNAARHHLDQLIRNGAIEERIFKKRMIYVPHNAKVDAAILVPQGTRQVALSIQNSPGATVTELAKRLGISRGTASYHVKRCQEAGLVQCRGALKRAWPATQGPRGATPA